MPRTSRATRRGPKVRVPPHGIVGDCPAIRAVLGEVRRYAKTTLPALVLGETGTGKELIAQELHRASGREGEFVAVSCPNLPSHLVESELFGHRRGAFTGAVDHRRGAFETADGGTLFLDEIGDMPLEVQAKVLRVLQEGVIRRLGETREIRVQVRIVAATWRDLPKLIAEGKFREDLYNRLAYCVVELPPLRERGHDVTAITRALLVKAREKHGLPRRALSAEAIEVLRGHHWPGNVRELERVLYRAVATGSGRSLRAADLRRALGTTPELSVVGEPVVLPTVEEVLGEHGGMLAGDLRSALGVSKSTLGRRLRDLVGAGRVVREGKGAATRYRLVELEADAVEDPRWLVALKLVRRDGRVTRGVLAPELGVSERTATRGVVGDGGGGGVGGGWGERARRRLPGGGAGGSRWRCTRPRHL